MAAELNVVVNQRETGKNESRRLRKQGHIPAVLYGEGKDPVSLAVEARVVDRILHSKMGVNTVFDIELAEKGQRRSVMIKDYQLDPVTDRLTHADFIRIDATHEVHVPVHVVLVGTAIGVKIEGGLLENPIREIMVACLPKDIPQSVSIDVSDLHVNQVLRVSDIALPEGVTVLTGKNTVVCSVHAPKEEAVPVKAAAEAAPAEGAAAATPAAGAEGAAAKGGAAPKKDEKEKKDKK